MPVLPRRWGLLFYYHFLPPATRVTPLSVLLLGIRWSCRCFCILAASLISPLHPYVALGTASEPPKAARWSESMLEPPCFQPATETLGEGQGEALPFSGRGGISLPALWCTSLMSLNSIQG